MDMTDKSEEGTVVKTEQDGNVGVGRPAELFIKTISITYGRKFNLDNYESVTLGATMWADRAEGGDVDTDFAILWETAREQVKAVAMPLLEVRACRRAAKISEALPATNSKPTPQAPPSVGQAPPPIAPIVVGTIPPVGNGPTVPIPGLGTGAAQGGKIETFLIDSVTALMTPNGNRCYTVRGGRVKKHGATMWPEVAQELETITGYDPENLEIGQPWDVASFNITATAEIPEGKKYPTKVLKVEKV